MSCLWYNFSRTFISTNYADLLCTFVCELKFSMIFSYITFFTTDTCLSSFYFWLLMCLYFYLNCLILQLIIIIFKKAILEILSHLICVERSKFYLTTFFEKMPTFIIISKFIQNSVVTDKHLKFQYKLKFYYVFNKILSHV